MDLMKDWDNELKKRKTDVTRAGYQSALRMVLKDLGMTPEEFVVFARDQIKFHKKMKTYFEELPLAPLTRNLRISAVQSFLKYMGIKFDSSIIEADRSSTVQSIYDTEVPSQQKLREIIEKADAKARASISLLSFCGLRPLLASHMLVKDIVDCEINNGRITFTELPARINVPRAYPGNKAKLDFFVFLIEEGAEYVEAWLNECGHVKGTTKILGRAKRTIQYWVDDAFKSAGFDGKVYSLRSYYDNALALESYKRSFYMGHKGDLHTRYILRKKLSPETINELRTEFKTLVAPRLWKKEKVMKIKDVKE